MMRRPWMTEFLANQGLLIHGIHHLSPREALAPSERGAALVDIAGGAP